MPYKNETEKYNQKPLKMSSIEAVVAYPQK